MRPIPQLMLMPRSLIDVGVVTDKVERIVDDDWAVVQTDSVRMATLLRSLRGIIDLSRNYPDDLVALLGTFNPDGEITDWTLFDIRQAIMMLEVHLEELDLRIRHD